MSIAGVSGLGTNKDKTAGTTLTVTATATAVVGSMVLVNIGCDNTNTTDGDFSEIASVTDSVGNTYVKAKEYTNGQGAAGAGCTVSLWWCRVTTQIVNASTILTVTFANSVTAKCVGWRNFSVAANKTFEVEASTAAAYDNADLGSLDLTVANIEHLWARADVKEGGQGSYTQTAIYGNGMSTVETTTGAADTNIAIWGEYDIVTATTNPSDPTWSTTGRDHASVLVAIKEVDVPAGATLSGVSSTSAIGTAAVAVAIALTGVLGTGSVGSVTPTQALSGNAASAAVGSVTPGVAIAAPGVAATGSAGSVAPAQGLSGVQVSGSVGSLPAWLSISLTGVSATGSADGVTPGSTISPSGISATGSAGTPVSGSAVPITGAAAAASAGTVTASDGSGPVVLSGVSGSTGVGSVVPTVALQPTGVESAGLTGAPASSSSVPVTGVSAAGDVGSVSIPGGDVETQISGVSGTGQVGAIIRTKNGIWQTSAGQTMTFYDDLSSDAQLDGGFGFTPTDFDLRALASGDWILVGSAEAAIRLRATIQSGDGVGSAPTTWRAKSCSMLFDSGKTFAFSTVGVANRASYFGEKFSTPGGGIGTKNGVFLSFGATTTLRGSLYVYDSRLRVATTGLLSIVPGASGLTVELVDSQFETAASNIVVGVSGQPVTLIRNCQFILGGNAAVSSFVCVDSSGVKLVSAGSPLGILATAGLVEIADVEFVGATHGSDARNTGVNTWRLRDVTWSDSAEMVSAAVSPIEIYSTYRPTVFGPSGGIVQNCPVRVLNGNGDEVLPVTYTDSDGTITHGDQLTVVKNSVKVLTALTVGADVEWSDDGPFTARYNMDGATLPGVPSLEQTFEWPRTLGTYAVQLTPFTGVVQLVEGTIVPPNPTSDIPFFEEGDIEVSLGDVGQDVSIAGTTVRGVLDRMTYDINEGVGAPVIGTIIRVIVKTDSLPGLAIGAEIGVDGEVLRVRDLAQIGDGALTEIYCAET